MTARKHIRAPKTIAKDSKWQNGNVPKSHAPFFKSAYQLHTHWYWREATLTSQSEPQVEYRLLVMLRQDKPNYKAWLSVKTEEGYAIVNRYELHNGHGGLHCHFICGEEHFPLGEIDPENCYTVPKHSAAKTDSIEELSLVSAWNMALKFYRVGAKDTGALV